MKIIPPCHPSLAAALVGGVVGAFAHVCDHIFIRFELLQYSQLKGQALFFRFAAGPAIGWGFFAYACSRFVVELRVIRVMGYRPRVPHRRVFPSRPPYHKGRSLRLRPHAAAPSFFDDSYVPLYLGKKSGRPEQLQRLSRAGEKLEAARNLDAVDCFRFPLREK